MQFPRRQRCARKPLIWREFLVWLRKLTLSSCIDRFFAVRKPQIRVFGAEPPAVSAPTGLFRQIPDTLFPCRVQEAQKRRKPPHVHLLTSIANLVMAEHPLAIRNGRRSSRRRKSGSSSCPEPSPDLPRQGAGRSRPRRAGPPSRGSPDCRKAARNARAASPVADTAVAPCRRPSDASAQCGPSIRSGKISRRALHFLRSRPRLAKLNFRRRRTGTETASAGAKTRKPTREPLNIARFWALHCASGARLLFCATPFLGGS